MVGGGAQSNAWCQIVADVTGRSIEVVNNSENSGAAGAAFVCGVGLGLFSFEDANAMIKVEKTFTPQPENREIYRQPYPQNRRLFQALNA